MRTEEEANMLMMIIEKNWDALRQFLEGPADLANGVLDCGGDCGRCPHPEYDTADEQVAACFTSIHESLGVPVSAIG